MKGAYRWRLKHNFNPRAPCGARPASTAGTIGEVTFQSTRPVRGAPDQVHRGELAGSISIHAPRAGRDVALDQQQANDVLFQSTRPVRGATRTHLPGPVHSRDFNPRAPCGARHFAAVSGTAVLDFNPRAPCGARRILPVRIAADPDFNPRAPCGARQESVAMSRDKAIFQSTRPVRGATTLRETARRAGRFQSTRPVRGATS